MLRITPSKARGAMMLKLEGKLCGPWVDELERCWTELQRKNGASFKVNLQEVSFLDARGKNLLRRMERQGASLVECSNFIRQLLDSSSLLQKESGQKSTIRKER